VDLTGLLSFADLMDRPRGRGDHRLPYGPDPLQFGDLWLPAGAGPHPVVVLIHGGCWLADLPGLELMDHLAEGLRGAGFAVWNIEYRRIGHAGGGWPGTFEDVGAGLDALRGMARSFALDLDRLVAVGHSAGGHLALWAAARHRLPPESPLLSPGALPVRAAVSLAGIVDLEAYRQTGPDACGGPGTIEALIGEDRRTAFDLYADTSPAAMLPLGLPHGLIIGGRDEIVPPAYGSDYARQARATGEAVDLVELQDCGHFELIDPAGPAWDAVRTMVARLAGER
jgi:acetyl esterase/lipase